MLFIRRSRCLYFDLNRTFGILRLSLVIFFIAGDFKRLVDFLLLFLLEFFLTTPHFVVVIDVTTLAFALGIDESLAGVRAFTRHGASPVLMVAVVAHSHGV